MDLNANTADASGRFDTFTSGGRRTLPQDPDPSVAAGRLAQLVIPWNVAAGAVSLQHTRFPRSVEEAREG